MVRKDNLPLGWNSVKLADACHLENGDRGKNYPSRKFYITQGIPFVTAGNLSNLRIAEIGLNYISKERFDRLGNGKYRKGDILFCLRGSLGKFAVVDTDVNGAIASSLVIIRPFEELSVGFLSAYLQSSSCAEMINKYNNGAAQPNLAAASLKKFNLPLPPLSEQHRIIAKLDSLFVRIDRAFELAQQNIVRAQQFMASVLNDALDDLDCEKVKVQDACVINPLKSEVKGLGDIEVSFLPMADLNEHQIDFAPKQTKKLTEVYTGYTYFKDGDVLLAKVTPCFENGKAGLASNLVNGIGFGSSEYYVLRANPNILPAYIYYNLTTSEFLRLGAQNMSGAVGLKRVTKEFLFNYKIPLPSLAVQENVIKYFADQTTKVAALTARMNIRLAKLGALKSSLLDVAFKGEL